MSRFFRTLSLLLFCGLLAVASAQAADPERVNINTASADALAAALTGVGVARAEAIVADREANGPFGSADDLARVSGVGASTVEANRDRILID